MKKDYMPFKKITSENGFNIAMHAVIGKMKHNNLPDEEIADAMAQWKGGVCPICGREYEKKHSNVKVIDLDDAKNSDSFEVTKIILSDFYFFNPPCNCMNELKHIKAEELAIKKRLEGSGIPKDMQDITFDNWDHSIEKAVTAGMKQCLEMVKGGSFFSGLGAVLCGTPGVGKTHIGVSMLRWIVENSKMEVLFVPMADIIGKIIMSGKDGSIDYGEEIRLFDVVMLDDIDKVNSQNEWVKQKIFAIIDGMMRDKKHIIITTNILKMLDFDEKFDIAISSRLVGGCQFVVFPEGHDYRKFRKIRELKAKKDRE